MKKLNVTLLAGLSMASMSLYMSAHGLVDLFAGAGLVVVILAAILELGKVGGVVWLIRNWTLRPLTIALTVIVVALSGVSSVGIFGFLQQANAIGRTGVVSANANVTAITADVASLEAQRAQTLALVEAIPEEHSTNRVRAFVEVQPRIAELDEEIAAKRAELSQARTETVVQSAEKMQLTYAADMLGIEEDSLIKGLILTLALIFDPFALLLILAAGAHRKEEAVAGRRRIKLGDYTPAPDYIQRAFEQPLSPRREVDEMPAPEIAEMEEDDIFHIRPSEVSLSVDELFADTPATQTNPQRPLRWSSLGGYQPVTEEEYEGEVVGAGSSYNGRASPDG